LKKDEKPNLEESIMVIPNDKSDAPDVMSNIVQSTDTNVNDYGDEINKDKIELKSVFLLLKN
jgi:hypothetical protein